MRSRRASTPKTRSDSSSPARSACSVRRAAPGIRVETGYAEGNAMHAVLRPDARQGDRACARPATRRLAAWPCYGGSRENSHRGRQDRTFLRCSGARQRGVLHRQPIPDLSGEVHHSEKLAETVLRSRWGFGFHGEHEGQEAGGVRSEIGSQRGRSGRSGARSARRSESGDTLMIIEVDEDGDSRDRRGWRDRIRSSRSKRRRPVVEGQVMVLLTG